MGEMEETLNSDDQTEPLPPQPQSDAELTITLDTIPHGWRLKAHDTLPNAETVLFVGVFESLAGVREFSVTVTELRNGWQALRTEYTQTETTQVELATGSAATALSEAVAEMERLASSCGSPQQTATSAAATTTPGDAVPTPG